MSMDKGSKGASGLSVESGDRRGLLSPAPLMSTKLNDKRNHFTSRPVHIDNTLEYVY